MAPFDPRSVAGPQERQHPTAYPIARQLRATAKRCDHTPRPYSVSSNGGGGAEAGGRGARSAIGGGQAGACSKLELPANMQPSPSAEICAKSARGRPICAHDCNYVQDSLCPTGKYTPLQPQLRKIHGFSLCPRVRTQRS